MGAPDDALQRFVDPVSFSFWESLTVVLIIVIGGLGNLVGVIIGAAVLILVPELLRGYSEYRMLLYGCALVAMILLRPRGLWPTAEHGKALELPAAK